MKELTIKIKDKFDIFLLRMAIDTMTFQAMRINKQANLECNPEWEKETVREIKRLNAIKKQLLGWLK